MLNEDLHVDSNTLHQQDNSEEYSEKKVKRAETLEQQKKNVEEMGFVKKSPWRGGDKKRRSWSTPQSATKTESCLSQYNG